MQRSTSLFKSGGTLFKSSAACVCRRPLAVVVERVGETRRLSRVVEVAAELHGAIVVLRVVVVVVGVEPLGWEESSAKCSHFENTLSLSAKRKQPSRRRYTSRDA